MRRKKKSRLAAAEFLAVLIVTAVVFTKGLSAALAWRGYKAVGGEFMLLLLPIIYIMRQSGLSSISWRTS